MEAVILFVLTCVTNTETRSFRLDKSTRNSTTTRKKLIHADNDRDVFIRVLRR